MKALALALAEAKARGLVIEDFGNKAERRTPWSTDARGYFTRMDGRPYQPTFNQTGFIDSSARFAAFLGGRGSGKTAAGAQRALKRIQRGLSGAVLNPDFENFRTSTWPELRQWIPWHKVIASHRYRSSPAWLPSQSFLLAFVNGATMICKGVKDPDSARGPNLNWMWYDEGGRDRSGMGWKIAIAGVRIPPDAAAWVTTTPRGRRHWLEELFVYQQIPEEALAIMKEVAGDQQIVAMYEGSIFDNKANLDPMFFASMLAAYGRGYLADQELYGKFVDPVGNLAQRAWFNLVDNAPVPQRVGRFWDLAATERELAKADPDYTAGARVSLTNNQLYVEDMIERQMSWGQIKPTIIQTAKLDGIYVPIRIEQEGGAAGKNLIAEIKSWPELAGYDVDAFLPSGDKVVRANSWFGWAEMKRVNVVKAAWNDRFLSQIEAFPDVDHDDMIDAVSMAALFFGLSALPTNQDFLAYAEASGIAAEEFTSALPPAQSELSQLEQYARMSGVSADDLRILMGV